MNNPATAKCRRCGYSAQCEDEAQVHSWLCFSSNEYIKVRTYAFAESIAIPEFYINHERLGANLALDLMRHLMLLSLNNVQIDTLTIEEALNELIPVHGFPGK